VGEREPKSDGFARRQQVIAITTADLLAGRQARVNDSAALLSCG
jgi:hypothetical protein